METLQQGGKIAAADFAYKECCCSPPQVSSVSSSSLVSSVMMYASASTARLHDSHSGVTVGTVSQRWHRNC